LQQKNMVQLVPLGPLFPQFCKPTQMGSWTTVWIGPNMYPVKHPKHFSLTF